MNEGAVAELEDCRVVLGAHLVLKGVSLRLLAGQFIALLGANGSGKTTLVRAMLGLVPREGGRVELFGTPLESFRTWGKVGYVPQRFGALSGVPATVEEVVLTGRIPAARRFRSWSEEDRDAAARALDLVGLRDLLGRPIADLSGGQQQRVLIARALVNDPDLLVLDEPVANVDLAHQQIFAGTLESLPEGKTVLLLAHDLGAMQPLVDRAIVLDEGKVVFDGPPGPEHTHGAHHHHPDPDHDR